MTTTTQPFDLAKPYELNQDQIERFREDGFIKLNDVFTAEELTYYSREITQIVMELNPRKGIWACARIQN